MQIQSQSAQVYQSYSSNAKTTTTDKSTVAMEKALKMLADEGGFDYKSLYDSLSNNDSSKDDAVAMKQSALKTIVDRVRIMRADRYTERSWSKLLSVLKKALPLCNEASPSDISISKALNNLLAGICSLVEVVDEKSHGSEDDKMNVFLNEASRLAAKAQADTAGASQFAGSEGAVSISTDTGSTIEISL